MLEVLHVNIRGFVSHSAELAAHIRLMKAAPSIVCINETFLDKLVENVELEGYAVIGRRDRDDGRKCGGVMVFARTEIANNVTLLEKSGQSERVWAIIHTDRGPYLLCAWYRPPEPSEIEKIETLEVDWKIHSSSALGTIIIGDINVHPLRWLRHSSRNSVEGDRLRSFCNQYGFQHLVSELTREANTLDLVLADIESVKCTVLPARSDHKCMRACWKLQVPQGDQTPNLDIC
jgi:hypothetical protein